ncbi:MAG: hypothetical protein QW057_04860 [Candidatus Bathyarchaeia archaeon]
MEAHLKARPGLLTLMELEGAPSRSVLHATVERMPKGYVKRLSGLLVEPLKGKLGR